jgi:hypothetical protein
MKLVRLADLNISHLLVGLERPEFTPVEILKGVVEAGSSHFYK